MAYKIYKIKYTHSSRKDIRDIRKYILETFKYRKLGENFLKKIKVATNGLKIFPAGFHAIGLKYKGYDIFLKPYSTYLLFYTIVENESMVVVIRVLQDRMDWRNILEKWLEQDSD